jgi:hypothetical protein
MFCPLCKAEYCDGFTECSDCRIPLLTTHDEAEAVGVQRSWSGGSRSDFEDILTALAEVGIPAIRRKHLPLDRSRGFRLSFGIS